MASHPRHLELSRKRPRSVLIIPHRQQIGVDDDQATTEEISFHRLSLPPGPVQGMADADLLFEKAWPGEGITCLISTAHCDGLVAVATTTDRVFVCNPATREFVALPHGSHNAQVDGECGERPIPTVALGFDQWRNRYIVARYFYRAYGEVSYNEATDEYYYSQDYDIGHEVFMLGSASGSDGASCCWELTQDPPHAVGCQRPICTRQAFYWHSDVPKPRLMRFGLQHRTFDVVSRPLAGYNTLDEMAELDGKLCYVHAAAEASFQVWLADETPELRWSLHYRIDLPNPQPRVNYDMMPVVVDGDALVALVGTLLCRYNVLSHGIEEAVDVRRNLRYRRPDGSEYMGQSSRGYYETFVVPYTDSVVSLA
ncbi:hypothetical protein BS78_03G214200 [Paspalum vaginatum]|nr:hypothetical protein BS78_03G214200 [Paspalum vaginatum]